ncbi:dnaJ homolog subfamily C member 18-like [Harmonia axyridis]|uniref:dnaJ homolog subfamily C member 18-like n=1 Tax=Harmonia axyridis TaxID=115357 RepID=UPI001E278D59|nr:dnaJ homolog subfamily C member 18-like [Harmonia axyridis]
MADRPKRMNGKKNEANESKKKKVTHDETTEMNDYTQEELEEVERIKNSENLYAIFGVNEDGTEEEIRKAYKKLALKVHPDKNKAPGAADAFKKIGNAVDILTDQKKRKSYDEISREEEKRKTTFRKYDHTSEMKSTDLQNLLISFAIAGTALGIFYLWSEYSDGKKKKEKDKK